MDKVRRCHAGPSCCKNCGKELILVTWLKCSYGQYFSQLTKTPFGKTEQARPTIWKHQNFTKDFEVASSRNWPGSYEKTLNDSANTAASDRYLSLGTYSMTPQWRGSAGVMYLSALHYNSQWNIYVTASSKHKIYMKNAFQKGII